VVSFLKKLSSSIICLDFLFSALFFFVFCFLFFFSPSKKIFFSAFFLFSPSQKFLHTPTPSHLILQRQLILFFRFCYHLLAFLFFLCFPLFPLPFPLLHPTLKDHQRKKKKERK